MTRKIPFPKLDQSLLDAISLINQARQDVADLMRVDLSDGVKGETGATPGTKMPDTRARATDPLQVAGGWKVIPGTQELPPGMLAGYHYAEGPGDLRIRTNDRALLDRILVLLDVYQGERTAAKCGVDLGGNQLPSTVDADRKMMAASEEYVAGRQTAAAVSLHPQDKRAFYDAAQMRAAFRAGYDFARK